METIELQKNFATQEVSVLWAVDPAEPSLLPEFENFNRLRNLFGGKAFRFKPVYVCTDRDLYLSDAKELVEEYLSSVRTPGSSEVEVTYSSSEKKSDLAKVIVNVSHDENSQMILLSSHGRSAVGTFFLGSFANELLKQSDLPILFLSPEPLANISPNTVLFATDFSDESKQGFQRLLQMIKGSTTNLILFHTVTMPIQAASVAEGMGYIPQLPDSFIEEEKEWAERELESWFQEARGAGVHVRFRKMVEESLTSAVATIERVAEEEGVTLVAVASHSGSTSSLFFGSVAREILSSKKFNLWVCGPSIKP